MPRRNESFEASRILDGMRNPQIQNRVLSVRDFELHEDKAHEYVRVGGLSKRRKKRRLKKALKRMRKNQ